MGGSEEAVVWTAPRKKINSQANLQLFLESDACKKLVGFIQALNEASKGQPNDAVVREAVSAKVAATLEVLDTIESWVAEFPPVAQAMRYGNPAFKLFATRLEEQAVELSARLLPDDLKDAAAELGPYLADSFGNKVRIDYGTGHETTFVVWMYCLAALGVFAEDDRLALVVHVFATYIRLMRKLQTTYWLEPAGSHGVWGLDDYQFMPFVWGSAQLSRHPEISPQSIHDDGVLSAFENKYLYLGCVQFVKLVKKGRLAETSPMLNDISGVPNWDKVNSGMMKMYKAEVLSKLPIMQHFMFGSLLHWDGPLE
mmetsp:Transcript_29044/g.55741  ORF Transcript_29044/g.55741 Transcript_29044/m.55741 type:complete len:312 (+) Transcript_29044:551-1486(+)|eukprot:CAMPEP_0114249230 /NCGR_PEP_ID=MMETSP0058-20121206/14027_1 /TAXON_ID=36894 /ORGANISM="Pyramimonas parkeae, CCMP726" /LENGTH=311 /DNA_ID=CAMNT_0001362753 /DNA_START=507 /DNA_END=1442 /DNA_ORIENTATION=+